MFCIFCLLTCAPLQKTELTHPPSTQKDSREITGADRNGVFQRAAGNADAHQIEEHNPHRRIFSFAENAGLAHVSKGGLLINFGTPGQYKYTLQNSPNGFIGDFTKNGRRFSNIRHGTSKIYFDTAEGDIDAGTVIIAGTAETQRTAQVWLNGKKLGPIIFHQTALTTEALEFGPGTLAEQNVLEIHCGTPQSMGNETKACLALDYIKITRGTQDAPLTETFEQSLTSGKDNDEILLQEGESISYYLPLPKQPSILIEKLFFPTGETSALEIHLKGEGLEHIFSIEETTNRVRENTVLPLHQFSGQVVSITFEAVDGSALMKAAELVVPALPLSVATAASQPVRNVVLLVIDTLRADRLRTYNRTTRVQAPVIEQIANESFVFEKAWSQASWTKPSVATLLTGLYPRSHGVLRHQTKLPEKVPFGPQHFQQLGYTTAAFIANGYISAEFGFDRGWNTFSNYGARNAPNQAKLVFQDAAKWIDGHKKDQPFFLYVHTVDPHAPYAPPLGYRRFYHNRPTGGFVRPEQTASLLRQIRENRILPRPGDRNRLEALYDAEITYHDSQLARLVASIEKHGLQNDTVFIITADHGEEFFDHGSVGHAHTLFEELIHVPLIIRVPNAMKPRTLRIENNVEIADVLPTICDILAVECLEHTDGRSLVPLMNGDFLSEYPGISFADLKDQGLYAIRVSDAKAIFNRASPTYYDLTGRGREIPSPTSGNPFAIRMLRDFLSVHLSQFPEFSAGEVGKETYKEEPAVLSPEIVTQLKSLGYIDG